MNNFLSYFIEANLYLVCFYLLYQILLVRDRNFRFNRAFLLGGIFLSLILPLLSFNVNQVATSTDSFEGYIILPVLTITAAQTESVGFILKWWHIIGLIYFAGVFFYFSKLIWQMTQIIRNLPLLNSSREKKEGYTLITTNGEIPTCSFFKFLFWDKSAKLSKEEQNQIFEHELAHIRQWHSFDVLLIELLRAVFWFNPAIHLMKSRITEVHEYLADFSATKAIGIESYSTLLTQQIFKSFDFSLSNNFHKSQILKRIRMLRSTKSKSMWLNVSLLVPTLALLITTLSCDVGEEILPISEVNNSPDLPSGWAIAIEQNLPPELQDKLADLRGYFGSASFLVAENLQEDRSFTALVEHFSEVDWNISSYNKGENRDLALLVLSNNQLPEISLMSEEKIEMPKSNEIFTRVENQPAPIGGMKQFYEYVQSNLKYPAEAKKIGIEGKVFVQFVVAQDGSLIDVKAVKGIGGGCDEEAVRVIRESLPWNAGSQRGEKVNVRMILPITFKLR